MEKFKNSKKWILISLILLVTIVAVVIGAILFGANKSQAETKFNLNERDILLEIGDSQKLELEFEENIKASDFNVSWVSSKSSVATVDEKGNVVAVKGGEAKVTAIVDFAGEEYSTSCVVTVKAEGIEYSTYKIRWYTQNKDRNGYQIVEETYERLIGSDVELTKLDANKKRPGNYVLNTEKCVLDGKVKKQLGACVLEVYFDVAQIQYTVDYYYESVTELGTYSETETKKYKVYAFTEVKVTEPPKTGFVVNDKVKGTVLASKSVVSGTKLKVYCDRARSTVSVNYISNRADATYNCIYGIGLMNAPEDVFVDSLSEYKIASYINGEKKNVTTDLMKTIVADSKVEYRLEGVGFNYFEKNGVSTITNNTSKAKTPSYTALKGSGNTVYLSANYQTTGSSSNTFGITLSSGGTSREIRFSKTGVNIMKDNTVEGGIITKKNTTTAYNDADVYEKGLVYVWAQSDHKTTKIVKSSVITDMLRNTSGGTYEICWAVLDGTLYCQVSGQTVLSLSLNCLEETWNADTKFEVGFSAYDATAWGDALKITNLKLKFNKDAEAMLVTDKKFESSSVKYMAYDPFTGSYLSSSNANDAYMYGETTAENTGVSTTIEWIDKDNTASAAGVSLKVGDESIQFLVEGQNSTIRRQSNHDWKNVTKTTAQVLKEVTPFNDKGVSDVAAFVKDGYFYVVYNGKVAQCINMLSLFPDYTLETEVSVGICAWDGYNGLARFSNVKQLNKSSINTFVARNNIKEWGFYSEVLTIDEYKFAEKGSVTKTTSGTKAVKMFGSSATWQIEGTMNRLDDSTKDLLMGFIITSGSKKIQVVGRNIGFTKIVNDNWSDPNRNKFAENPSVYNFNDIVTKQFFNYNNEARTQEWIQYKAVLYKDVLYVWFTDVNGNTGLSWRIPLTEEEFGAFAEGSNYQINIFFSEADTKASVTDIKVKMGYQVTEQKDFVDSYTFKETIKIADANIAKWANFKTKGLTGMLADELDTILNANDGAYAYLKGSSKDIYLTATYEMDTPAKYFGITLKEGDNTRQILYHTKGVALMSQHYWNWTGIPLVQKNSDDKLYLSTPKSGYTYAKRSNDSVIDTFVNNLADDKTYEVKWAVTDGVVYGMVDNFVFLRLPLTDICESWNQDTELQIGFAQHDLKSNGDVLVTKNIEVSYGEEALAKMVKDHKFSGKTDVSGVHYEVFTGTYLPDATGNIKYMYGPATNQSQVLNATITMMNKDTTTSSNGITVKDSVTGKSAQVIVEGQNIRVRLLTNYDWNTRFEVQSWIRAAARPYTDAGVCAVTAVVKNQTLYIMYNGVLAGSVDLYKLLPGYAVDNGIQLGVCSYDANGGLVSFTGLSHAEGNDAVKDLALSNAYRWEILQNKDGKITYAGTNMSGTVDVSGANNIVNISTVSGSGDARYIYGTPTNMSQMLTTKVSMAESKKDSSNGITVKCGTETIQISMNNITKTVRSMVAYGWNSRINKENFVSSTPFVLQNGYYVADLTAVVHNEKLYVLYGTSVALEFELDKIFKNYSENATISLGVFSWGTASHPVTFQNVIFSAGQGVVDYYNQNCKNKTYKTFSVYK